VPAGIAHVEIARIADVLAESPKDSSGWLSDSEQARLATIRNVARRAQYLAGHWLTRVLLARGFGGTPVLWSLLECKSQAPWVLDHADHLKVSISHSGDWVAAAVATVAIGIDLEQRPRTLDATIEPLLRNTEEAPGSLSSDQLLQRWVAKEAWLKRNGESALPERLRQLHLRASSGTDAQVHVDSHDEFHFGLAVTADCTVNRYAAATLVTGPDFAITDLESTVITYRK
jgi:phosphopantetheinyl transferase